MTKFTCFLWTFFFLAGIWLPGNMPAWAGKGEPKAIHISERVKIERSAPPHMSEAVHVPAADDAKSSELPGITAPPPRDSAVTHVTVLPDQVILMPAESLATDLEAGPQGEAQPDEHDFFAAMPELGVHQRYYVETGRVDPFQPFLRRTEQESDEEEETIIRRTPRTPLERIALGQLILTAIVTGSPDVNLAMVQDSMGKGYVIRQGTYVGQNGGRISMILPDKVIVEKPYRDVFGKTSVREIELQLQKRAGE